jgi:hypothetical protein
LAGQEFEEQEMEPDDTTELACRFMPSCRFAALGMAPPRRADEALDVRERLQ